MTNFCLKIGSLRIIGLHHKKYGVKILPLPQHFLIEFRRNTKSILLRTGGGGEFCGGRICEPNFSLKILTEGNLQKKDFQYFSTAKSFSKPSFSYLKCFNKNIA